MVATTPKMGDKRRIAIATSGGDAPGMNGVIRSAIRMALLSDCETYVIREGYEGLVRGEDFIRRVHWDDVRGWLSIGGTLIGSARSKDFRNRAGRLQAAKNLVLNGIDSLVVCGGDGSLIGANVFRGEWQGLLRELVDNGAIDAKDYDAHQHFNIVGVVGSIDNDLTGTDSTIGCFSALHRIIEAVDDVFDTAASHQRAFVVEVMGRHCGWLALMSAICTGADWVFIPEQPPYDDWEELMCSLVIRNRERGKRRIIVILAEGAQDRHLNPITSIQVKDLLAKRLNLDARVTVLGHTQRGGAACVYDRWLSTMQGVEAIKLLLSATPSTPSQIVTIRQNSIEHKPLMEAVELTKRASKAVEDKDFFTAMQLRDAEFKDYLRAFERVTTTLTANAAHPGKNKMKIAIVHVGAPAGGMNPATRAVVSWCYAHDYVPYAIQNGFPGLCRHHADNPSSVKVIPWVEADSWVNLGGSEMGTNRGLPSVDMPTTAKCFEKYGFDGLLIIGGFEGFTALSELRKAREQFPSLRIPMVLLPATISNNVPGSEYSLGSDTCLNALANFCDVVRQSASSSRRRVFVIETQGGQSGYVATLAGLCVGAYAVYTPEEGIKLDMLARDITTLRGLFVNDRGVSHAGKVILRNECASDTYTTTTIAQIIREESGGHFETRSANPGHYQQGGKPSAMDRVRALRMGVKCVEHLSSFSDSSSDEIMNDENSAAVIGSRGSGILVSAMGGPEGLEEKETDWQARRPKNEFWRPLDTYINLLSGRWKSSDGA